MQADETGPQDISEYVLPFSTSSEDREEPFTKDMERAAIFCLAELERAKGTGVVLKHPPEKLVSIAEVCYPFWFTTLGNTGLIFDGLCTASQTLTHSTIPDTESFIEDARRSSTTREAYMNFLQDNINYFQVLGDEEEKTIKGLITDPDFLHNFHKYLRRATPTENPMPNKVTISPTFSRSSIISVMEELQDLASKFEEEVNLLYQSMKIVKTKTNQFLEVLREETRTVQEEFSEEIQESKVSIAEAVQEIQKEYDEEVTGYSKMVEEELITLQQEKIKLDKIKRHLTSEIEQCEAEIKTCTVDKDGVSEKKWKERRDTAKEKLAKAETKIIEVASKLKEVKDEKKLEIFNLKSERDAKIREVEKNLVEIESSRDAKTKIYKEEMEKLEELTTSIIDHIANLAKLREKTIDQFENLGIQLKQKRKAVIYMPFYLACYKSDSGRRYTCFPPSTVKNVGLSVRFKGALGKTKIKQLLQPRSERITSLLNDFPTLMEKNPVFNREINEACIEVDLLQKKAPIKTGLEKLTEEGWLSEKEFEAFSQELV